MDHLKLPSQLRLNGGVGNVTAINTGNNGTLWDNCTCGNVLGSVVNCPKNCFMAVCRD